MAVRVLGVDADSPVIGRLHVADVLISLDHTPLHSFRDLKGILDRADIGVRLTFQVQRDSKRLEVAVEVPESRTLGITSEPVSLSAVMEDQRIRETADPQLEVLLRIEQVMRKEIDLERVLAACLATANYTRVIALSVLASLWSALLSGILVVVISSASPYDRGGGTAVILIVGISGLLALIIAIIVSFSRGVSYQGQA